MLTHPLCKYYIQISLDLRVYVRRIRNGFLKNHLLPKIQIKSLQIYTSYIQFTQQTTLIHDLRLQTTFSY